MHAAYMFEYVNNFSTAVYFVFTYSYTILHVCRGSDGQVLTAVPEVFDERQDFKRAENMPSYRDDNDHKTFLLYVP